MREVGGKEYFQALMDAFERYMAGAHRGLRAGQPPAPDGSARDAVDRHVQLGRRRSWRLDPGAAQLRRTNGYRGYLEDRRPNSQGDPYRIAGRIIETIAMVDESALEEREAARAEPDGG